MASKDPASRADTPSVELRETGEAIVLRLGGAWRLGRNRPATTSVEERLRHAPPPARLLVDGAGITDWDSTLLMVLLRLARLCAERGVAFGTRGLPEGVERLIQIARAVPPPTEFQTSAAAPGPLERLGASAMTIWRDVLLFLDFVGEVVLALGRFLRGRSRYRKADLLLLVQQAGVDALGIVTLITFLVGLILAFIGAVQLQTFGAEIYIADLVGIAMVRQMGGLMTAIILAGRTGAAFAAQLGAMNANEEIDALRTLGVSPIDFLVVPRILALVLMMPVLTVYAMLMGMLGGAAVAIPVFGISPMEYFYETQSILSEDHFIAGMIYAVTFAALIAVASCLRGIHSGRDAAAVGQATTSAVVTSIVLIVAADAILTIVFDAIDL